MTINVSTHYQKHKKNIDQNHFIYKVKKAFYLLTNQEERLYEVGFSEGFLYAAKLLQKQPIQDSNVKKIVGYKLRRPKPSDVQAVINKVCIFFEVHKETLMNKSRAFEIVRARNVVHNLLFEKYKSIEQDDLPQKTINLLTQEDKSFIKKLFNYEIKLMNALASAAAILLLAVMVNYNFENTSNKDLNNLEAQNKNSILNELKNIIGDEEVSTLTSSVLNKTVKYEVVKEFVNNSNEKCSEIRFYEFKIKDLNIDEAIFLIPSA